MNIMIDITKPDMFKDRNNIDTLAATSLDDTNGKYMTESQELAINFDKVKEIYREKYNFGDRSSMNSVDAVLKLNNRIVFIEFKNGKINSSEKKGIRWKVTDSVIIFSDLTSSLIEDIRVCCDFILVYNLKNNPHSGDSKSEAKNRIVEGLRDRANQKYHRFGIAKYQSLFFKNVYAYSKEEFEKFLSAAQVG